jgi:hypothetical protein
VRWVTAGPSRHGRAGHRVAAREGVDGRAAAGRQGPRDQGTRRRHGFLPCRRVDLYGASHARPDHAVEPGRPPRSAAVCAGRWRTGGALRHPPSAGRGRTEGLIDLGLRVPVCFPRGDVEQYGWDRAAADGPIAAYPVAEPYFCRSAVLGASRTCVYWAGCPGCPRVRSRRRSCLRDRRYDTVR